MKVIGAHVPLGPTVDTPLGALCVKNQNFVMLHQNFGISKSERYL